MKSTIKRIANIVALSSALLMVSSSAFSNSYITNYDSDTVTKVNSDIKKPVKLPGKFTLVDRFREASRWASLSGGEVVIIDSQVSVLWTRIVNSEKRLMVKNYGVRSISPILSIKYTDTSLCPDFENSLGDIVAGLEGGNVIEPGASGYGLGTWNACGTNKNNFKVYLDKDGRQTFLAELSWLNWYNLH